jgi:ribosomal protein L13E
MPAQSFDTNTVPKPPLLTYVSVGAKPSKELAKLIGSHCHPRDVHNATAVEAKGKRPARRAHDMSKPEQSVVVVSHLCGSKAGRHQVVLALRNAGLGSQHASMLGFATSLPKGETKGRAGKAAGAAPAVVTEPETEAEPEAEVGETVVSTTEPDKPKGRRNRRK